MKHHLPHQKKYKSLLLSPKDLATTVVMPSEPHISALFCYNSNGYKLNPFIIIPNLKNLPDELIYFRAFFSSQKSGWMSGKLFASFALYFASCVSVYRQSLSPNLRDKPIYFPNA